MDDRRSKIFKSLTDLNTQETASLFKKLTKNLSILEEYFDECYLRNYFSISFNGGKDCTAALVVLKYFIFCKQEKLSYQDFSSYIKFINKKTKLTENIKIRLIYFLHPDTFTEEIDYCYSLCEKEGFELALLTTDYKTGLFYLKQTSELEHIFMGIRKDDVAFNTNKDITSEELVQWSDGKYPRFTRLYPIFQLDYKEVWMLLLQTEYPYLSLYDKGFTSLGKKSKSLKNESLLIIENTFKAPEKQGKEENTYYPAYCLEDLETERSFRVMVNTKKT